MNATFKVVERRGAGIEYDYQTGFTSISKAHELMDSMNYRASTLKEEFLQNGDGNAFDYVVRKEGE